MKSDRSAVAAPAGAPRVTASMHALVSLSVSSIMAASEDSAAGRMTLRAAGAIAAATGARLHVVHDSEAAADAHGQRRNESELQRLLAECLPAAVQPSSRLIERSRPDALVDAAFEHWPDLIVLGPQHAHARTMRVLGTAAEKLLSTSGCSCLIVNGELSVPLRRVVVAVDLHEHGGGALHEALQWVTLLGDARAGTQLLAVHVANGGSAFAAAADELLGRRLAAALAATAAPEWIDARTRVVHDVSVADAVTALAVRENADLVVAGKHARAGVARAVLGSVAAGIAAKVARPALLVPPALCFS